jgi:hypothetical protein
MMRTCIQTIKHIGEIIGQHNKNYVIVVRDQLQGNFFSFSCGNENFLPQAYPIASNTFSPICFIVCIHVLIMSIAEILLYYKPDVKEQSVYLDI